MSPSHCPANIWHGQSLEIEKAIALRLQGGRQLFTPAKMLHPHQTPDALMHPAQLFRRRQAVKLANQHPGFDLLLQPHHAHLEQLIEIGTGDAAFVNL
jgi:hypothetical protein